MAAFSSVALTLGNCGASFRGCTKSDSTVPCCIAASSAGSVCASSMANSATVVRRKLARCAPYLASGHLVRHRPYIGTEPTRARNVPDPGNGQNFELFDLHLYRLKHHFLLLPCEFVRRTPAIFLRKMAAASARWFLETVPPQSAPRRCSSARPAEAPWARHRHRRCRSRSRSELRPRRSSRSGIELRQSREVATTMGRTPVAAGSSVPSVRPSAGLECGARNSPHRAT